MPGDRIVYVGHSTTRIEMAGCHLLTDPVLGSRIGHIKRISAPPAPEVRQGLAAVLVSHAHHDHLDVASLKQLRPGLLALAPPGAAEVLRRRTRLEVVDAVPGARIVVGSLGVLVVPAQHDGRRFPIGPPRSAVGYVVEGPQRICFFGDTDLHTGMEALAGSIDVALLPIWGWGPKLGPGHLDPERAARAAGLLRPRIAVPVHWGTLASPRVWWRHDPAEPARKFQQLVEALAPGVEARIVSPGAALALDG